MATRFSHLFLISLLLAGCSEQESPGVSGSVGEISMKLAPGMQWIGRVQRTGGGAPYFDTLRIDSTIHSDSVDWYHFEKLSGTGAPRPDWLEGEWVAWRGDGLYTTRLRAHPDSGDARLRRLSSRAATGDTVLDFGTIEELSIDGAPVGRMREIGILTAVDEEIEVPAGRFTAYRIELRRSSEAGGASLFGGAMYDLLWFAPGAGLVRAEAHIDSGRVDQVWELVGVK